MALITLAVGSASAANEFAVRREGRASAPVELTVFSSPTCIHCVKFFSEVLPKLRAGAIGEGRVKIAIRPFVRNFIDAVIVWLLRALVNARTRY